eukprot:NODE_1206_length_1522_cov_8.038697_g1001_i0.p1 GENE.NODE_1206_length_1522_cov_8.038697_g1001_i0~~NODE_1206_length_1522_cov_8.038697_g1001_i0.p1  ORF type:complete len:488 (-),score=48.22 NODE_1206_length_1522_cov_8.038697_g1001_i0:42-1505(-)
MGFAVYDKDTLGKGDFLGRGKLELGTAGTRGEVWVNLEGGEDRDIKEGSIRTVTGVKPPNRVRLPPSISADSVPTPPDGRPELLLRWAEVSMDDCPEEPLPLVFRCATVPHLPKQPWKVTESDCFPLTAEGIDFVRLLFAEHGHYAESIFEDWEGMLSQLRLLHRDQLTSLAERYRRFDKSSRRIFIQEETERQRLEKEAQQGSFDVRQEFLEGAVEIERNTDASIRRCPHGRAWSNEGCLRPQHDYDSVLAGINSAAASLKNAFVEPDAVSQGAVSSTSSRPPKNDYLGRGYSPAEKSRLHAALRSRTAGAPAPSSSAPLPPSNRLYHPAPSQVSLPKLSASAALRGKIRGQPRAVPNQKLFRPKKSPSPTSSAATAQSPPSFELPNRPTTFASLPKLDRPESHSSHQEDEDFPPSPPMPTAPAELFADFDAEDKWISKCMQKVAKASVEPAPKPKFVRPFRPPRTPDTLSFSAAPKNGPVLADQR